MKVLKHLAIAILVCFSISSYAQDYEEFIEFHRNGYKQSFVKDLNAPLKEADLKNLHFFEPNINFRVEADIKLIENAKPFNMPTYEGNPKSFIKYATATGEVNGNKFALTIFKNMELANNPVFKDYLFLPFTDMTNGKTSYGGGRYMDFKIQNIENGKLVIDFNLAYNPYCAFSTGYRCPVPPQENDLNFEVTAGEKKYTGDIKSRPQNN